MLSFEEAGKILDDAAEALPGEIFKNLNGGINLLPDERRNEDGGHILGLYHNDAMGRYIEIFYGSFTAIYPEITREKFSRELKKTLHHELTHHIESLAGDRTLEIWDEEQKALWDMGGPLYADSILFVCGDDTILAPAACAMFMNLAGNRCPRVRAASAGMNAAAEPPKPEAAKAAAAVGADIYAHVPVQINEQLLAQYEAVLCMSIEQGDELARHFPKFEQKIMCFAETDIKPPKLKFGWSKVMKRIRYEVEGLINELCMEDE